MSDLKWKETTKRRAEVRVAALSKTARKMMSAGSSEVIQIGVSGTLVQGQQAKDEVRKKGNRQGIQKSSLVEEDSDMKRNEFEALALSRK